MDPGTIRCLSVVSLNLRHKSEANLMYLHILLSCFLNFSDIVERFILVSKVYNERIYRSSYTCS